MSEHTTSGWKKSTKEQREKLAKDLSQVLLNPALPSEIRNAINESLAVLETDTNIGAQTPEILLTALPLQIEIYENFGGSVARSEFVNDHLAKLREVANG